MGNFFRDRKNEIPIYNLINTPDAELFRETAIFLTWDNRTFPAAQIQKKCWFLLDKKHGSPQGTPRVNERICHQNIIKNSFAFLVSLRLYSMSTFANRRRRFKTQEKTPAGTLKNECPCSFFSCEFAVRTRFCLEPPPSWRYWYVEDCFFWSNAEDARIFLKERLKLIKNRAILYTNDRKTHW